jgi:hypothetical protein
LVSCCARIVNQNKWPTLLHGRADVTTRYRNNYVVRHLLHYHLSLGLETEVSLTQNSQFFTQSVEIITWT